MLLFLVSLAQADQVAKPAPTLPSELRATYGDLPFVGKFGLMPKIQKKEPEAKTPINIEGDHTQCSVAIVIAKNGKVVAAEPTDCNTELTKRALEHARNIRYQKPEVMGKKQMVWTIRTFAVGMFAK